MRYWKRVNTKGETTTVESYSHDLEVTGAVEIDKAEHDIFIDSLPKIPPIQTRDLIAEFDSLKSELKSRGLITL